MAAASPAAVLDTFQIRCIIFLVLLLFDRFLLVILASHLKEWKQALLILKPDTLLRWHRASFKLFWKFKSRPKTYKPKIGIETKELIEQMARENPLWGAERIRGELLKLNIKVSKRTILKYMQPTRPPHSTGQNWKPFLKIMLVISGHVTFCL